MGTFDYLLPRSLADRARVGCRVTAPFNNRRVTGYILETSLREETPELLGLKEILDVLDDEPLFHEEMVPFFEWMADYYLHPLGRVIQCALPGGLSVRSYKAARLTEAGRKACLNLPPDSEEASILTWVGEHPGERLSWPLGQVHPLEKKGWLAVESCTEGDRVRPLVRQFVRVREGATLESLCNRRGDGPGPENESEFLQAAFEEGPLLLSDLSKRFSNGAYLVQKWIKKGVLEKFASNVCRNPAGEILCSAPVPDALYAQQQEVLDAVKGALDSRKFSPYLLHGVTGSGKTEVYYAALEHAIGLGRKAILLTPEIALATYLQGLFRSRLGDRLAVYHSGLSAGERYDQWVRMARGEVDLVVGARSALFSPLPDLGLVVVDEEHDAAYKQEGPPRYQARDAAVMRAKMQGAVALLGSGTPSVQSFQNCVSGRYGLLSMPHRVERRPLPEVEIVDLKAEGQGGGKTEIIGSRLREALRENLSAANQAILFLNRRGFHRSFLCRACGEPIRCPNCDVALTHHLKENLLICHYCGFHSATERSCPRCGRSDLKSYGFGTEKLQHELRAALPGARIGRLDADSTRRKGQAFQILRRFKDREIDVLVGTQMVTKGYDFPMVTLVGVVAADLSLEFPDFRAAERTFQVIAQVAGRAGRGARRGRVIIQTYNPSHYAVSAATAHDYAAFFKREIDLRKQLGYPPFSHLASVRLEGNSEKRTEETAMDVASKARALLSGWGEKGKRVQMLGPVEAAIYRLKGKYRRQILFKSGSASLLRLLLRRMQAASKASLKASGVRMIADIDPYQMS